MATEQCTHGSPITSDHGSSVSQMHGSFVRLDMIRAISTFCPKYQDFLGFLYPKHFLRLFHFLAYSLNTRMKCPYFMSISGNFLASRNTASLEIGYGVQSEKMLHEEYLEKETNRCLNHHDAEGREERFFLPFTNILLALC